MKKNSLHKTKSLLSLCASIVFIFHFSFFIFSCSGEYIGVPRVEVLSYQTAPTYGGLHSLATAYGQALNDAVKADTLHPGMYAEYGVTLALMGHKGPACRMLNAEMKAFPESRGIVTRIKQRLMPDMVADTLAALRDTANLAQLAEWAYDSLTVLKPFSDVPPVIDRDARVKFRDQMTEKVSAFTDENFWENYNVIEPDADIEAIIRKIVRQLKKHNLE